MQEEEGLPVIEFVVDSTIDAAFVILELRTM